MHVSYPCARAQDTDCRKLGGCVMGFRGVAMRADMLQPLEVAAQREVAAPIVRRRLIAHHLRKPCDGFRPKHASHREPPHRPARWPMRPSGERMSAQIEMSHARGL